MNQEALFQPVLTLVPALPGSVAELPEEARMLLTSLRPHVRRNVLYEEVFQPAPAYFAHLATQLSQAETYHTGMSELRRQQAFLQQQAEHTERTPAAPSERDLETFWRQFNEIRQVLDQTPPLLGTIFWYVPGSDLPNGLLTSEDYLSRLIELARSNHYGRVQAGNDEMMRYLGKSEEQRYDALIQSIAPSSVQHEPS